MLSSALSPNVDHTRASRANERAPFIGLPDREDSFSRHWQM